MTMRASTWNRLPPTWRMSERMNSSVGGNMIALLGGRCVRPLSSVPTPRFAVSGLLVGRFLLLGLLVRRQAGQDDHGGDGVTQHDENLLGRRGHGYGQLGKRCRLPSWP